jgi:hypothetical protein
VSPVPGTHLIEFGGRVAPPAAIRDRRLWKRHANRRVGVRLPAWTGVTHSTDPPAPPGAEGSTGVDAGVDVLECRDGPS